MKERISKCENLFSRWPPSAPWYDHVGMLACRRWPPHTILLLPLSWLLHGRAQAAALLLLLLLACLVEVFGVVSLESSC